MWKILASISKYVITYSTLQSPENADEGQKRFFLICKKKIMELSGENFSTILSVPL